MASDLELNNYHSYALGPCACGAEWVHATSRLCFDCRKGTPMTLTALTIQPPNVAAVQPHSQTFAEYLSRESRSFIIQTDEDLQLATNIINDIKARMDQVQAMRVAVTQPINQGLRTFNAFFKPFTDAGQQARELFNGKIRDYTALLEEQRRLGEVALQEAIATQDAAQATAAIQALRPAPKAVGLILQDAWAFEEFNHDIVPTQLTLLDPLAVQAEIKRQLAEGVAEPAIPGLKVFKRQVVKTTTR